MATCWSGPSSGAFRSSSSRLGEGWTLVFAEGLNSLRVAEHDKTTILRRLNNQAEEQVNTFLEAIASGEPSRVPTSYADALAALSVCEAAVLSMRQGAGIAVE